MSEPSGNGDLRAVPTHVPLWMALVSIGLAVGITTLLLLLLVGETTGPGQVVGQLYEAARNGDCDATSALFERIAITEGPDLCAALPQPDSIPTMAIESVTLEGEGGETARVRVIEGGDASVVIDWGLRRDDDTWVIRMVPCNGAFAGLGKASQATPSPEVQDEGCEPT